MNAVLWGNPEEAIRESGLKMRLERQGHPGHGGDLVRESLQNVSDSGLGIIYRVVCPY